MIPQTDKSCRGYRALNQKWSYQPPLAGRAISTCFFYSLSIKMLNKRLTATFLLLTLSKRCTVKLENLCCTTIYLFFNLVEDNKL